MTDSLKINGYACLRGALTKPVEPLDQAHSVDVSEAFAEIGKISLSALLFRNGDIGRQRGDFGSGR